MAKKLQLHAVTKELRRLSPHLELERGEGYHYFIFDDGGSRYETESVMVCYLNQFTMEQWLDAGTAFLARIEERT